MNRRNAWPHSGRWMAVILSILIGAEGLAQAPDSVLVEEYAARRRAFAEQLAPNTVALFRAAPTYLRNGDQEHDFRQANNLYYLTGYPEREAVLLLAAQPIIYPRIGQDPVSEVLFVMDRNPTRETWDGIRYGPDRAGETFGFEKALSIAALEDVAVRLFAAVDTVLFDYGMREGRRPLPEDQALIEAARSRLFDITVRAGDLLLAAARQVKSPSELRILREAILITCDAHKAAMRNMRSGMFEYEIQAEIEYVFKKRGAVRPGFPSIVGSGPMSCILHYNENNRQTQDGELVLMDLGAEFEMYTADVTRTVPVSGTFTDRQRAVLVREVLLLCGNKFVSFDRSQGLHDIYVKRAFPGIACKRRVIINFIHHRSSCHRIIRFIGSHGECQKQGTKNGVSHANKTLGGQNESRATNGGPGFRN